MSERWAKTPLPIVKLDLSRDELRAFIVMSAHASRERITTIGQRAVAEELEVDRRSARRLLAALEASDLIRKIPAGRGRRDSYLVAPFEVGASDAPTLGERTTRSGRISDGKWAHPEAEVGASGGAHVQRTDEQRPPAIDADASPAPEDPWGALAQVLIGEGHDEGDVALAVAHAWCRVRDPSRSLENERRRVPTLASIREELPRAA